MKIASYNFRFGGRVGEDNQWQQLVREFDPEIVFAQESFHPNKYFSTEEFSQFKGCVYQQVPVLKWGSAILSKTHQLEPLSLPQSEFAGWVVGARVPDLVIGGVTQSVLLFSIHAPSPGNYEKHVDKILSSILQQWGPVPMILGGDFNLTAAAVGGPNEILKNTSGELKLFRRLKAELGLANAWRHFHPAKDLPQTLRWSGDKEKPFHCDAIFLSEEHLSHLTNAHVESSGIWATNSDHNPVVITLD